MASCLISPHEQKDAATAKLAERCVTVLHIMFIVYKVMQWISSDGCVTDVHHEQDSSQNTTLKGQWPLIRYSIG